MKQEANRAQFAVIFGIRNVVPSGSAITLFVAFGALILMYVPTY
jgi:hypothetical protein